MADFNDSIQPASSADEITPSDSVNLTTPTRAIYVGTGGTLKVIMVGGQTVEFQNLAAGVIYPIAAKRVFATVDNGTVVAKVVGIF
jgi:hypothetical protein